ncbi:MAG: hypothetical protein JO079_14960, partial [Frankiaceae bacterium]|nr:hypothetical protein [Frankiaceae bacterium]
SSDGYAVDTDTGTGWVDTHPADDEPTVVAPVTPPTPAAPTSAVETPPTGILPLDQIFETREPGPTPTVTADAPTWTAMPVVPVRSEPVAAGATGTWAAPYDRPAAAEPHAARPHVDLDGARVAVGGWLRRDDNGLMLLTALVACILMIVVAGVGG